MNILGINAYHGNASAAVVCEGKLIAAVEEERFNRVKYAAGFPAQAIRYCLKAAGLTLNEIDHVAVPRNPYARLATKIFYALRMPSFARERAKVLLKFQGIPEALAQAYDADPKKIRAKFHRIEHHQAHLASSFYCSPFDNAALLSADGLGDFASTMWGTGNGRHMKIEGAIAFPHSLGLFYSAVTQYLGFLKFGDEYKVMGLAAYGQPEQLELFGDIVRFENGSDSRGFRLGLDYFSHHRTGPEMSWAEAGKTPTLGKLFSEGMERRLGPARSADQALEQRHRNLAASLQVRLEEVYLGMLKRLADRTRLKAVCLAGGVALALQKALQNRRGEQPVEIEVRSLAELEAALTHGAEAVLLDNMSVDDVHTAVARVRSHSRRLPLEVSGGIKVDNVRAYAETGAEYISVGALTHSAPAVDLSMRIVPA